MRAVKRSPLFRIAVLSLAVLLAHTAHAANPHAFVPAPSPCPRKVAAAQPDPEKNLAPAIKRVIRSTGRAHFHTSFPHPLAHCCATTFRVAQTRTGITLARHTAYIPPQRNPFALRI